MMARRPPAESIGAQSIRRRLPAAQDRTVLPIPRTSGDDLRREGTGPQSPPIEPLRLPAAAPNVLIGDAGLASSSAFVGPINTEPTATLL
jgi:hypothetical protein